MATKSALQRKGILGLAQLQAFDCWNNVCERTMMKTIEGKRNNFGVIFFLPKFGNRSETLRIELIRIDWKAINDDCEMFGNIY